MATYRIEVVVDNTNREAMALLHADFVDMANMYGDVVGGTLTTIDAVGDLQDAENRPASAPI